MMYAFPVLFALFAGFYGWLSFRILVRRKPVIMHSGWLYAIIIAGLLPAILTSLLQVDFDYPKSFIHFLVPLMFLLLMIFYFFIIKGYTFYGISGDDLRSTLLEALGKLDIKYEETLNKISLPEKDAALSVAVQDWMGTGMIRINKRQAELLKEIITKFRELIAGKEITPKIVTAIFYMIFAVLFLIMVVIFSVLLYRARG